MDAGKPPRETASHDALSARHVELLRAALAEADQSGRYRLLGALLDELAIETRSDANGRPREGGTEPEALRRKTQALTEEKANLVDANATAKADLEHRTSQLESEQTRAHKLEQVMEEGRARLQALQHRCNELEGQSTAREAELHKAHAENDKLLLDLQRAELAGADESRFERMEESKHKLGRELEVVRAEMEQIRADKDAEITKLNGALSEARSSEANAPSIPFGELWARLASAKPPMVDAEVAPTVQSAQRFVDTFLELARCVDDFDKLIRPFLASYTKQHQPVAVPWNVYANRDGARKTIEQMLKPIGGKPVGVVTTRLRQLYAWTESSMIAGDATLASCASELQTFLLQTNAEGSPRWRDVKEFLRDGGPHLFLDHLRKIQAVNLEKAWRGG